MLPSAGAGDTFGTAVAHAGQRLAIGAPLDENGGPSNAGSVTLYSAATGGFAWETTLMAADAQVNSGYGGALALAGDLLVVGARLRDGGTHVDNGAVYVYRLVSGAWTQEALLESPTPRNGAQFGAALALDGQRVLIGAPRESVGGTLVDAGAAYLFEHSAGQWTFRAYVRPLVSIKGDLYGTSVALHGNRLLVGAPGRPGPNDLASDALDSALFGSAVDLADGRALVGAPGHNFGRGRGYLYTHFGPTWVQSQLLLPASALPKDELGGAVSLSGNRALLGSRYDKVGALNFAGSASLWTAMQSPAAAVTPRLPCTASAPAASLWALDGAGSLASTTQFRLDDPTNAAGLAPGTTVGLLALCTAPAPGYPCGFVLPGLGTPSGLGSEVLVSLAGGDVFALKFGGAWQGPGTPFAFQHVVPGETSILGVMLYVQGLFVDGASSALVLSEGLDLKIGY